MKRFGFLFLFLITLLPVVAQNQKDPLPTKVDQEKELDRQPETINELPPNLQKLVDNSILMYYLIMKMSTTNNQYQIDAYKKYIASQRKKYYQTTSKY